VVIDRLWRNLLSRKFSFEAGGGRNQTTMAGHGTSGLTPDQLIEALVVDGVLTDD
jgi:hypothetical protein